LVGLPLLLLPTIFTRKMVAKRLSEPPTSTGSSDRNSAIPQQRRVQDLVDELRARLSIPNVVEVTVVPENKLVVSVERLKGRGDAFSLSIQAGFIDDMSDEEVAATVAHELGHVWIFTHHPYLHTEELANQIAMRVSSRETLSRVYERVWRRTGVKGTLMYVPEE
jgi:hypothetical protein